MADVIPFPGCPALDLSDPGTEEMRAQYRALEEKASVLARLAKVDGLELTTANIALALCQAYADGAELAGKRILKAIQTAPQEPQSGKTD